MKIFFAGTPAVAVPALERLAIDHEVVGVLTRPDAPVGRKREITPSPVATRARELGIQTHKSSRFDAQTLSFVRESGAKLGVVVAYGALVSEEALNALDFGWINAHFSHLPLHRGAAPLQRDIMSGAETAGISIFELVTELDAGDLYSVSSHALNERETAGEALSRLAPVAGSELSHVAQLIESGSAKKTPQFGLATYAHKLTSIDGQLQSSMNFMDAFNRYRGVTPEPGAWIDSVSGRIKVLECTPLREISSAPGRISQSGTDVVVGFQDGCIALTTVQPAGKSPMSARDWVRGIVSIDEWMFS
jgi:methionyl-tRNA formyltransferase